MLENKITESACAKEVVRNKNKASEVIERLKGLTIQEALFVLELCKETLINEQIVK